ncbi:MAG: hypothetical protein EYC62_04065 [Alphaproteobacteria bacterium]|nr:MAG: hypothetical protein EYC62_04065 [Alphaproteobacteria bacterium]
MPVDGIAASIADLQISCASDTDGFTTLVVLANSIMQPNGLLLVWFVLHNGEIKGFKTLIEPLDINLAKPSIMEAIVTILTKHETDEWNSAFGRINVYPLSTAEMWELIVTKGRNAAEYEPLKRISAAPATERQQIPRAVFDRIQSR